MNAVVSSWETPLVDNITISLREYNKMKYAERFLDCLESVGLENWERYEIAKEYLTNNELHFAEEE
jgi:hypothetical protein